MEETSVKKIEIGNAESITNGLDEFEKRITDAITALGAAFNQSVLDLAERIASLDDSLLCRGAAVTFEDANAHEVDKIFYPKPGTFGAVTHRFGDVVYVKWRGRLFPHPYLINRIKRVTIN